MRSTGPKSAESEWLTPERLAAIPAAQVTFLCGAGISYAPPAGLPTVRRFIDGVVTHCTDDEALRAAIRDAASNNAGTAPRFEGLVESLSRLNGRAADICEVFDAPEPNLLHRFVAQRCLAGAAILTTNFDNCIERAATESLERVVFAGKDLQNIGPRTRVIVKPHGSNPLHPGERPNLVASIGALGRTAQGFTRLPRWREYLLDLLRDRHLVVLGYSGSDDFDLTPVLLAAAPAAVLWIDHDTTVPLPRRADPDTARSTVGRICEVMRSEYFRGPCDELARAFLSAEEIVRTSGTGTPEKLAHWLHAAIGSPSAKQEVLSLVLRHFGLHELTITATTAPLSAASAIERASALYYRGRYLEACEVLRQVRAENECTPYQACQTAFVFSAALYYAGDPAGARAESLQYLELADTTGDPGEIQSALNHAGAIAFALGQDAEARSLYERVLAYQDEYPSLYAAATATWGLGDLATRVGDLNEAVARYEQAKLLCDQLGRRQGVAWMAANLGDALRQQGALKKAEVYLREADGLFVELGVTAGSLFVSACLAKLSYCVGRLEDAADCVRRCLTLAAFHGDSVAFTDIVLVAFLLAHDDGQTTLLDEVKRALGSALQRREHDVSHAAAYRLRLCLQIVAQDGFDDALYRECQSLVSTK